MCQTRCAPYKKQLHDSLLLLTLVIIVSPVDGIPTHIIYIIINIPEGENKHTSYSNILQYYHYANSHILLPSGSTNIAVKNHQL